MLGEVGWKEIDGGVGGVARVRLQEMKGRISGTRMWDRGEERADNGVGLFQGGDESGGRGLGGGDEASAANFDGEKGLRAGGVSESVT